MRTISVKPFSHGAWSQRADLPASSANDIETVIESQKRIAIPGLLIDVRIEF